MSLLKVLCHNTVSNTIDST